MQGGGKKARGNKLETWKEPKDLQSAQGAGLCTLVVWLSTTENIFFLGLHYSNILKKKKKIC